MLVSSRAPPCGLLQAATALAAPSLALVDEQATVDSVVVMAARNPLDELAVFTKLPAEPGVLYLPIVQTCDGEESQRTGIPDPDDTRLSHPAPALRVLPSETHQH